MNRRFPLDVLMIIVIPPLAIAAAIVVTFYMPNGVRHHLAVILTFALAVGLVLGTFTFWMRRRKRRNT